MKGPSLLLVLAVAVALTAAEPPQRRSRPAWAAPQRQVADAPAEEAPYPPSGWRPSKAFPLPGEYGAPDATYGAPTEEAATEEVPTTTTEAAETTTATPEEASTTEGPQEEEARNDDDYDTEPEPAPANIPAPGVYYVLLPDGTIQRVAYQAVIPAPPSGRYIIEEVEPLRAPLFAYGAPRLIRLLKK